MAATTQTQVRPRREREEEVLVWPDLVFIEFIAAALFTFAFIIISAMFDAPLINRANPDVTPNPSKAPWYFMNLQELLLHMNGALAGVIVPTIALLLLAAVPYLERSSEGQGVYFGTKNSVKITIWSAVYSAWFTAWLILFDQGRHRWIFEHVTGWKWPFGKDRPGWLPNVGFVNSVWDLAFIENVRSIQTKWTWNINLFGLDPGFGPNGKNGRLDWPDDFSRIPMPFNGTSWPKWGGDHAQPPPQWYQNLPDWLTGLFWYDLNLNLPAFIVEILLPVMIMVGLPALLIYILWRVGWVNTRRDVAIALFSGFITTYWVMTIVGAAFRGQGQDLVLPWSVPHIDG